MGIFWKLVSIIVVLSFLIYIAQFIEAKIVSIF